MNKKDLENIKLPCKILYRESRKFEKGWYLIRLDKDMAVIKKEHFENQVSLSSIKLDIN